MMMRKGQVFRCQNPRCGSELQVERDSLDGFSNPICCCGAEMAIRYDAPAVKKLEPSPEVMVLLKLLAELHGFELVEKSAGSGPVGLRHATQSLEPPLHSDAASVPPAEAVGPLPLEQVRELHIQRVVEMCGGNRARAAQILGISRNSLYRTLKRMGQVRRQRPSVADQAEDPASHSQPAGAKDIGPAAPAAPAHKPPRDR